MSSSFIASEMYAHRALRVYPHVCLHRWSRPACQRFHLARRFGQRQSYSTGYWRSDAQSRARAYVLPITTTLAFISAGYWLLQNRSPLYLDAPPSSRGDPITSAAKVQITGKDHGDDVDKVKTGTSTIPYFPKSIWLPRSGKVDDGRSAALPAGIGIAQEEEEYQLLGLGVRKVSLFRIEVYVVGLYVAKSDLARLQEELVKVFIGAGASTLVGNEKTDLKKRLLDGKGSEQIWNEVLKHGGVKSAVRITPVKNTNFSHMRDGWIRAIDFRGKGDEFADDVFKQSVSDFKAMLAGGKGTFAKGKILLLGRGTDGSLRLWAEEDAADPPASEGAVPQLSAQKDKMRLMGRLQDERVSRLVWLNYVAGDSPASEDARQSVVDGVIDLVERPIGTVETQVV